MPTGERRFEEIAMHFIKELPESEGFKAILVGTDGFSKVQYYILAETTCTAEPVANSCINDIWRLYGLLRHITSDLHPQFAWKFLQVLYCKLNSNLRLSTTYYPQADGLSE